MSCFKMLMLSSKLCKIGVDKHIVCWSLVWNIENFSETVLRDMRKLGSLTSRGNTWAMRDAVVEDSILS